MKRRSCSWLLVYLLALLIIIPSQAEASRAPKGAVKLSRTKLKNMGTFYCGNIKRSLIPGRLVKKLFYSHEAELSNLSRQLKRARKAKQRAKLEAQIKELDVLIEGRTALCLASNESDDGPGGGDSAPAPITPPNNDGEDSGYPAPSPAPTNDDGATPPPTSTPSSGINSLRFNLSGATALALADYSATGATFKDAASEVSPANTQGYSNLRKILPGGGIAEVLESGSASFSKFLVGPNNKLYVLFQRSGHDNANSCLLGEVDTTSGLVSCIDNTLNSISWSEPTSAGSAKPLQFDSEGNLYYLGSGNGMMQILRKYDASTKTTQDLITENNSLGGYLVMADGSVLYAGSTNSSNTSWLRKRRTDGGTARILELAPSWMSIFPDGRVYVSYSGALYRMRQDAEEFEKITWNEYTGYGFPVDYPRLHTANGSVYGVYGYTPHLSIAKIFPVPHDIKPSVERIFGIQPILSNLIIYGSSSQGEGKLILYNLTSGQEQNLIGDADLEIYRVEFLVSENAVHFDAFRFTDSKYVLCTVYLDEGNHLACSPTGSVKLVDFQSLSTPGVRIPAPIQSPTPIAMIEADFTGAKALIGIHKIKSDGSVAAAIKFSEGRQVPSFTSDNLGTIWIRDSYLTDQDTQRCTLAKIDRETGMPTCVFSGAESIDFIKSRGDGGVFFITRKEIADQKRYTLHFHQEVEGATQLDSWLYSWYFPFDAIITSTGSLLLSKGACGLRNYQSDGTFTDLGVHPESQLGQLPDGRILVAASNPAWDSPRLLTVAPDGEAVNTQPYAYHHTSGSYEGEVECVAGYHGCRGGGISKFFNIGSRLFSLSRRSDFDTAPALISYTPGPVRLANVSLTSEQAVATASSDTIYLYGTRNGSNRLFAYDVESDTEDDLTEQVALDSVLSMIATDNKLYVVTNSSSWEYNRHLCSYSVVVRPEDGGEISRRTTTLPGYCSSGELIAF